MKLKILQSTILIIAGLGIIAVLYLKSADSPRGGRRPLRVPRSQNESTLDLQGKELKVNYTGYRWGPVTFGQMESGNATGFVRIGKIILPEDAMSGERIIPSGEYQLGIRSSEAGDFYLVLAPPEAVLRQRGMSFGPPGRGRSLRSLRRGAARSGNLNRGTSKENEAAAADSSDAENKDPSDSQEEPEGTPEIFSVPLEITDVGEMSDNLSIELETDEQSKVIRFRVRYGPKLGRAELKIVEKSGQSPS